MSIALSSVTKSFGSEQVVRGVSLDIERGEFFAILGPSGCGKTTLLRLIAGLETLDSGDISINGQQVASDGLHLAPEKRNVGVVFQSYALWPHMTVADNVAFPLKAAGQTNRDATDHAQRHLETVELHDYSSRQPAQLSGGKRQRVALARCLAQGAQTILMDEPLANLDPHLRAAMEEELAEFQKAAKATVLYITHDQREAMALADRLAVMWQGEFLQVDAPDHIYRRPSSERVARFIGRSAIVDGTVISTDAGEAIVRIGDLSVTATTASSAKPGPARLVIRPEDIVIGEASGAVKSTIDRVAYRGGYFEAAVREPGIDVPLAINLPQRAGVGESIRLTVRGAWLPPEQ